MTEPYYPDLSPIKTGLAGKCPRCGRGKLFAGYLTVAPTLHRLAACPSTSPMPATARPGS